MRPYAACLLLTLPLSTFAAPDLVLLGGQIYTVDDERTTASAVAIEAGRIAYVGDDTGARALAGPGTKVVELGGKMMLPSFQDVHSHFASSGLAMSQCPVFDLPDAQAVLAGIRRCVEARPDAELIRGDGWTVDQFPDGPPRKELLDAIDATRLLVFQDGDRHALWLNSRALEAFGITAQTPDPLGGKIARDPETGEPSGTLHDDSAMNLVKEKWPAYTDAEFTKGIKFATKYFHSVGITATNEAIVKLEGRGDYVSLPALAAMNDAGELGIRTSASLFWVAGAGPGQIDAFRAAREKHSHGRLRVDTVKFWADGVVETRTAKLLAPYSDAPETSGLMMIPRDELMWAIPAVAQAGFQVHVHTIGDATARYALDALQVARETDGARRDRHYLNHVEFLDPADLPRFAELDVAATFEPLWAIEDIYITELTRPRVGPERIQWTFPIGAIARTGARIAFSSDWAVSSANPLLGIEASITRQEPLSNEGPPFLPEQAISLVQAISAYTRDAAYLLALDAESGTIETGKRADLVVLDRDLFEIPVHEISDARVVATLMDGEVVYGTLEQRPIAGIFSSE